MSSPSKLPFVYVSDYDSDKRLKKHKGSTIDNSDFTLEGKCDLEDSSARKPNGGSSYSGLDTSNCDQKPATSKSEGKLSFLLDQSNVFCPSDLENCDNSDETYPCNERISEEFSICEKCEELGLDQSYCTDMIAKPLFMGSFNFRHFSECLKTNATMFTEHQQSVLFDPPSSLGQDSVSSPDMASSEAKSSSLGQASFMLGQSYLGAENEEKDVFDDFHPLTYGTEDKCDAKHLQDTATETDNNGTTAEASVANVSLLRCFLRLRCPGFTKTDNGMVMIWLLLVDGFVFVLVPTYSSPPQFSARVTQ